MEQYFALFRIKSLNV